MPERLLARAGHVIRVPELAAADIAHARTHIPRRVAVVGPVAAATALRRAGLAVTLYTDEDVSPPGIPVRPLTDPGPALDAAPSLIELVGRTPLVRLDRVGRDVDCHLLAKLELLNPGGSVKDRPALAMIDEAERQGRLRPGGTIVEPTSGNTGVGLAIVAARRRYRCIFVMPDKIAAEKVALLRAYGAEVIVCPTAVPPEHPESYYSVSDRLVGEIPGAYKPDQYSNPMNPEAHARTTGPEIWEQTRGRITHLVASIGTGGTITGLGRYLKSKNPEVRVVGADPEGSVYSGGTGRPYLVEGVGEDFWPGTYDRDICDEIVPVSDRDSFAMTRRLAREEGLLLGGSCGMAVVGALEVARRADPDDVVVVLLPDGGRGYLGKVFSDPWMASHGFLAPDSSGATVADVLLRKDGSTPQLVHTHPNETIAEAVMILREFGVSQLPVVSAEPPVMAGEVIGAVNERTLLQALFAGDAQLADRIESHMAPALPTIGGSEPIGSVMVALADADAALVLIDGKPTGVVTRQDVLGFLAGR